MNDIGKKLKELREKNGLTRKDAVDRLSNIGIDISDKTLYGYESGRNSANADMFLALCQIYNCKDIANEFSELSEAVLFTNAEWELIEKYRNLDLYGQETVSYILDRETKRVTALRDKDSQIAKLESTEQRSPVRFINYYYRLASAGTGQIVFDMPPTHTIEIPDTPEYKKANYAIGVNGSSMEPTYHDGDVLLVEMTDHIDIGEIGIFLVDGQSYVKQRGHDKLISLNKNFQNVPLTSDSRCMGRVIARLEF